MNHLSQYSKEWILSQGDNLQLKKKQAIASVVPEGAPAGPGYFLESMLPKARSCPATHTFSGIYP
jgi:hypothetical protein